MDWDSESFEPPTITPADITNKWDGEDEEETVKDNWEDDDEEKKKEEHQKKPSLQSKKPKSRLEEKIEERERKEIERRAKLKFLEQNEEIDISNMTPEQIQAEKLRREKLQKEADLEVAKEMLGLPEEDTWVDKMNPKTKEEFTTFKDTLCKKISLYKKSEHFSSFMEELFRDLSAGLSSTELKKIKLNMDNMFNEKVRVEKLEKGKKTKGKAKAKLRVEGSDMVYDEYSAYTVDDYDDFM